MFKWKGFLPLMAAAVFVLAGCGTTVSTEGIDPGETAKEGNAVFVSALGSDTNSGLKKASPLLSLQAAVNMAKVSNFSAIYISGDLMLTNLTNGFGVLFDGMTGVKVSGGWDSDFVSRSGESVLNGGKIAVHVVGFTNCSHLNFYGFAVTGGEGDQNGAGIFMVCSANNTLNCTISNNYCESYGGGLYLGYSDSNLIQGTIASNSVGVGCQGGGMSIECCRYNTVTADFHTNYAEYAGGGVVTFYISNTVFSGDFIGNISGYYGGGIDLYFALNCTVSGDLIDNQAFIGGGLYDDANYDGYGSNKITGDIRGNTANQGGGVYVFQSVNETYSGSILSNVSYSEGGGMYIDSCSLSNHIASSCRILYNHCDDSNSNSYYGGGIYLYAGLDNTIESGAVIVNNYRGSGISTEDNIYTNEAVIPIGGSLYPILRNGASGKIR